MDYYIWKRVWFHNKYQYNMAVNEIGCILFYFIHNEFEDHSFFSTVPLGLFEVSKSGLKRSSLDAWHTMSTDLPLHASLMYSYISQIIWCGSKVEIRFLPFLSLTFPLLHLFLHKWMFGMTASVEHTQFKTNYLEMSTFIVYKQLVMKAE